LDGTVSGKVLPVVSIDVIYFSSPVIVHTLLPMLISDQSVDKGIERDAMSNRLAGLIRLPVTITSAILNAESDWIRYGVPAVLLTVIFFFAMRFETPTVAPPRDVAPARRATPSAATSLLSTTPNNVAANRPMLPAANLSEEQVAAQRALCSAVGLAVRKNIEHRTARILRLAIETYRGQGGSQVAARAVNNALSDYRLGKWSEEQCPPDLPHISKGVIGEVCR
jgi:hypothetical protein